MTSDVALSALERLANSAEQARAALVSSENRAAAAAARLRSDAAHLLRLAEGLDADAAHARLAYLAVGGPLEIAVSVYHGSRTGRTALDDGRLV